MYLLPIYFCLCSFIFSLFLGKHFGSKGSVTINIILLLSSLICSLYIFYEVGILHINCYLKLLPWIQIGTINIQWSFLFDTLSSTMLIVILIVSCCANIYSVEYMSNDPHKIRFFAYLSLFTFTMLMLVTSSTLVQLFFGWEFVGITSYLLINFWYTRIQANKSSILAVMANKIGDILLLFTCLLLCSIYHSVSFNVVFLCCDYYVHYINNIYSALTTYNVTGYLLYDNNILYYILLNNSIINVFDFFNYNLFLHCTTITCFFIVVASICKSAQSGFHFWLAEAMEGPTPVSSLLHAATMVTAGIFLIIRCSFLFTNTDNISIYIIFIGALTSFFASLIGITQNDLKKIVAYSTCSQLGYMFLCNGICAYNYTMFHLFNHAFFKALLFLTSGYLIHLLSNEQDLRKMGGFLKILPFTYICLFIGSLSLMGVPYLSGFFSKDVIIEAFYSFNIICDSSIQYYNIIFFSQLLLSISLFCTILYSIKVIYYIFINTNNGYFLYLVNIHYCKWFMIVPLIILSVFSICSGYFMSDLMIGIGNVFWGNSFSSDILQFDINLPIIYNDQVLTSFILLPYEYNIFTYYYIFILTVYFITLSTVFFIFCNQLLYESTFGVIQWSNIFFININKKLLFYNRLIIVKLVTIFFLESYRSSYKLIDKQLIEVVGPFGLIFNMKYYLKSLNSISLGYIYHYAGIIIITCIIIFLIVL